MADVHKYFLFVTIVFCELIHCALSEGTRNCNVADKTGLPDDVCTYDLRMKGAQPKKVQENKELTEICDNIMAKLDNSK